MDAQLSPCWRMELGKCPNVWDYSTWWILGELFCRRYPVSFLCTSWLGTSQGLGMAILSPRRFRVFLSVLQLCFGKQRAYYRYASRVSHRCLGIDSNGSGFLASREEIKGLS